jgi:rare lipoprotein A
VSWRLLLLLVAAALAIAVAAAWLPLPAIAGSRQCGIASWYGYTGHRTANGERFDGGGMTAAHRTLPFGTRVRVTDLRTGRSIVVRINDRGPYVRGRIIDLSPAARRALGIGGLAQVCIG